MHEIKIAAFPSPVKVSVPLLKPASHRQASWQPPPGQNEQKDQYDSIISREQMAQTMSIFVPRANVGSTYEGQLCHVLW